MPIDNFRNFRYIIIVLIYYEFIIDASELVSTKDVLKSAAVTLVNGIVGTQAET